MTLPLTSAAFYLIAFLFFLWLALLVYKPKKKEPADYYMNGKPRRFSNNPPLNDPSWVWSGTTNWHAIASPKTHSKQSCAYCGHSLNTEEELKHHRYLGCGAPL